MTEQQFINWCDEYTRAEWVNGEVIIMSPVNWNHAELNTWLSIVMYQFVEHHELGSLVGPQVQMRLGNVVSRREPDVLFVAKSRSGIIRPTFLDGPPDLVLEIVSPESVARDWREKYNEYAIGGIREYWVIDTSSRKLEASMLGRSKVYKPIVEKDGKVSSTVMKGFYLRPEWLWQPKLPRTTEVVKELGVR